jgi:hypothetical protein
LVVREAARVERLAYTRTQAAEAIGVSRSTLNRRVLPYIQLAELPSGRKLVPVDELERLLSERRQAARQQPTTARRGRPTTLPEEIVRRIKHEHSTGTSLAQIARGLETDTIPTAHGATRWWPSTVRAVLKRTSP